MKGILVSLLLLVDFPLYAVDYYVSNSGNDSHTGTSQSAPWRSIIKVNDALHSLKPGDRILFRRGEIFYGTVKVTVSGKIEKPVTFGSYGTGAYPVITGFREIKNWVYRGNGIYSSVFSCESKPEIVTVDGVNTPIGRWPDKLLLTIDSLAGDNSFTDSGLQSTPCWTGAELVIRKNAWIWDRHKITRHAGEILEFTDSSDYKARKGSGYFIQSHINTLDQFGEWYYDGSLFFMYFGAHGPGNTSVKVSSLDNLAHVSGKSSILFENLSFEGASYFGLVINNSNHISVRNCNFTFIGKTAIFGPWHGESSYCTFTNTIIRNCNSNGILLNGDHTHAAIINNRIINTGLIPGMGGSGDGTYNALTSRGSYSLIKGNIIENSGYMGIHFAGDSTIVTENFIKNFCLVKNDGGGIYTYIGLGKPQTGGNVTANIIIDGHGYTEGTIGTELNASGIYIDDRASGITISGNTAANCSAAGIYLHNSHGIEISNNTLFNNGSGPVYHGCQLLMVHDNHSPGDPLRSINITGNIFFAYQKPQKVLVISTLSGEINTFGWSENNRFIAPEVNGTIIRAWENGWDSLSIDLTLSEWREKTLMDTRTTLFPGLVEASKRTGNSNDLFKGWKLIRQSDPSGDLNDGNVMFEYNPSAKTRMINISQEYTDLNGLKYKKFVELAPFSSIILFPARYLSNRTNLQ